jgi:hypothetical protein
MCHMAARSREIPPHQRTGPTGGERLEIPHGTPTAHMENTCTGHAHLEIYHRMMHIKKSCYAQLETFVKAGHAH